MLKLCPTCVIFLILLTPRVNGVKTDQMFHFLKYELGNCLFPADAYTIWTLRSVVSNQLKCIHQQSYNCLNIKEDKQQEIRRHLCCLINTGEKLKLLSRTWILRVRNLQSTRVTFQRFHLPCSEKCTKGSLTLNDLSGNHKELVYCGFRNIWRVIFYSNILHMKCSVHENILPGYNFLMLYEALHYRPMEEETSPSFIHDTLHFNESILEPYMFPLITQHADNFRYWIVYFLSHPLSQICITGTYSDLNSTALYDGPGNRSPKLERHYVYQSQTTESGEHYVQLCFTSFAACGMKSIALSRKTNVSQLLKWKSEQKYIECNRSKEAMISLASESQGCIELESYNKTPLYLDIQQMEFHGPNMLLHKKSSWMCQYGGIFVFEFHTKTFTKEPITSICNTLSDRTQLSFGGFDTHTIIVVFKVFGGYSSGAVNASLMKSPCRNYYYGPACSLHPNGKHTMELWGVEPIFPNCLHLWSVLNYNFLDGINRNCTYDKMVSKIKWFPVKGKFTAEVYNSFFYRTKSHHDSEKLNSYFNLEWDVETIVDFPVNNSLRKEHIIVPSRSNGKHYTFNHLHEMSLKSNYSVADLHTTLVQIRIAFALVCHPGTNFALDTDIAHLDLYESYPSLLDAHIQACHISLVNLNSSQISSQPHRIILRQGINKDRMYWRRFDVFVNGSGCSIDMALWELFTTNLNISKVRQTKWFNRQRIKWWLSISQHGFKIQISVTSAIENSSTCDLRLQLIVHKEGWFPSLFRNTLMAHFHLSDLMPMNWTGAYHYCLRRNKNLFRQSRGSSQLLRTFALHKYTAQATAQMTHFAGYTRNNRVRMIRHYYSPSHKPS